MIFFALQFNINEIVNVIKLQSGFGCIKNDKPLNTNREEWFLFFDNFIRIKLVNYGFYLNFTGVYSL